MGARISRATLESTKDTEKVKKKIGLRNVGFATEQKLLVLPSITTFLCDYFGTLDT